MTPFPTRTDRRSADPTAITHIFTRRSDRCLTRIIRSNGSPYETHYFYMFSEIISSIVPSKNISFLFNTSHASPRLRLLSPCPVAMTVVESCISAFPKRRLLFTGSKPNPIMKILFAEFKTSHASSNTVTILPFEFTSCGRQILSAKSPMKWSSILPYGIPFGALANPPWRVLKFTHVSRSHLINA